MPLSRCSLTMSATPLRIAASYSRSSNGWPVSFAFIRSSTSTGRGRLPTWVVRIRFMFVGQWLLHRALRVIRVLVVLQRRRDRLQAEAALRVLRAFELVPIVDREVVVVVLERPAY